MTVNTTPLKGTIQAWRDLNAERVTLLSEMPIDLEGQRGGTVDQWHKLHDLDTQELFRLRDIAGEAMQLVDEIEAAHVGTTT